MKNRGCRRGPGASPSPLYRLSVRCSRRRWVAIANSSTRPAPGRRSPTLFSLTLFVATIIVTLKIHHPPMHHLAHPPSAMQHHPIQPNSIRPSRPIRPRAVDRLPQPDHLALAIVGCHPPANYQARTEPPPFGTLPRFHSSRLNGTQTPHIKRLKPPPWGFSGRSSAAVPCGPIFS